MTGLLPSRKALQSLFRPTTHCLTQVSHRRDIYAEQSPESMVECAL